MYPYESSEPGDLTFVVGEVVTVTKKDGDWWTGTIGLRTGVFPSNYVQKAELQYEAAADSEVEAATAAGEAAAEAIHSFADLGASSGKRPNTAPVDSEIEVLTFSPVLIQLCFDFHASLIRRAITACREQHRPPRARRRHLA